MKSLALILLMVVSFSACGNDGLPQHRHITVEGSAELQAKPDIAVISLAVESVQKLSIDAKKDVDDRVNNLLDGLAKFNVDKDNVSASTITTRPNYSYTNNKRELVDYTASRDITVTLNNIDYLNDFMDFALSMKINSIRNIELKSSKASSLKDEVNLLAVENAKQQGQSLAGAFGAELGKIYSINTTSNSSTFRFGANKDIEHMSTSRISAPSRPGEYLQESIVFSATIHAVFDLELD